MNQRPPEQLGLWTDEGVAFVDAAGQGEGGESRLTSSVTAAPGAQAASTAAEARATVPEAALLGSLPVFRHPRTEREIRLGKALVGYECKRVRRRSIGMVVSDEGLSVRAPTWVSWADIELALRAHLAVTLERSLRTTDVLDRERRAAVPRRRTLDGIDVHVAP